MVDEVAAELRREPAGEPAVEREAVRVGLDLLEGGRIGDVVDNRDRAAAAGTRDVGRGPDPVADEQALDARRPRETYDLAICIVPGGVTMIRLIGVSFLGVGKFVPLRAALYTLRRELGWSLLPRKTPPRVCGFRK